MTGEALVPLESDVQIYEPKIAVYIAILALIATFSFVHFCLL